MNWIATALHLFRGDSKQDRAIPTAHQSGHDAAVPTEEKRDGEGQHAAEHEVLSANGVEHDRGPLSWSKELEALAYAYSNHVQVPLLRDPLLDFLTESSTQVGLDGLGLAVWRTPDTTPLLCVYAFMDFGRLGSTPGYSSPYAAMSDAFNQFRRRVRAIDGNPIRVVISFQNTARQPIETIIDRFPVELDDQMLGPHTLGETITKFDLRVMQRAAVRAA